METLLKYKYSKVWNIYPGKIGKYLVEIGWNSYFEVSQMETLLQYKFS